jgi:hypothetical protein
LSRGEDQRSFAVYIGVDRYNCVGFIVNKKKHIPSKPQASQSAYIRVGFETVLTCSEPFKLQIRSLHAKTKWTFRLEILVHQKHRRVESVSVSASFSGDVTWHLALGAAAAEAVVLAHSASAGAVSRSLSQDERFSKPARAGSPDFVALV